MTTKKKTSWSDLKAQLVGLEKTELLQLVKDLYSSSKDTQQFLHARYAMGGGDVLAPYKDTSTQSINPSDVRKPLSVAKAKKAIVDYKKAVGQQVAFFQTTETISFLISCGNNLERKTSSNTKKDFCMADSSTQA